MSTEDCKQAIINAPSDAISEKFLAEADAAAVLIAWWALICAGMRL